MQKQFSVDGWEWDPERCPCDRDFINWLDDQEGQGNEFGLVFHMGTGMHHKVGLACDAQGIPCIGLTVSVDEYMASQSLQGISSSYGCLLGNIYKLDYDMFPDISYLTLFHLGEMESEFGSIDVEAIDKLLGKVVSGGKVFFYSGSNGFGRAFHYIEHAKSMEMLGYMHDVYHSLLIFRKI